MTREELDNRLFELLQGKTGTLTKVSVDSYSPVAVGSGETGTIELLEHEEGMMAMIFNGWNGLLKTSPIQSIELVEPIENGTRVLFKTRTSIYEAMLTNGVTFLANE